MQLTLLTKCINSVLWWWYILILCKYHCLVIVKKCSLHVNVTPPQVSARFMFKPDSSSSVLQAPVELASSTFCTTTRRESVQHTPVCNHKSNTCVEMIKHMWIIFQVYYCVIIEFKFVLICSCWVKYFSATPSSMTIVFSHLHHTHVIVSNL